MGIRDKQLICIIKQMLKAPVIMPDGSKVFHTKETPQGGILSPLLANIVLNELDWWVNSQWENMPTHRTYGTPCSANGTLNKWNIYEALRKSQLKEMYLIRYADDFKIYCRKRNDADKTFIAVKKWLRERLKLDISEEKSKVVNLKKNYSEFLGFRLKTIKKGGKFVVSSHMSDKAVKRETKKLKKQLVRIQHSGERIRMGVDINLYNLMVLGIHNYYRYATAVSLDCQKIQFRISVIMYNRFRNELKKTGQTRIEICF